MKSLYVLNRMPWMSQTQAFNQNAIKLKCNVCKERKESEPSCVFVLLIKDDVYWLLSSL